VLSGTPVTGINFSVANAVGVTVSGRVRRATGAGSVVGQTVLMRGGTSGIQQATTAADGSFQFPRVRPGTYQLGSAQLGSAGNQPISVVVGDTDVTGLEIVVVPTAEVTGNVAIEGNGPRPRIQIQLSPYRGGQGFGTSSQPDGAFRATLPEGEYRVSWSGLPPGYEIKSLTAGNLDLLMNSLKVSVDTPPPAIRLVLSLEGNPWVKVSGRVINFGSTRALTLSGPSQDPIPLTINPDGTFEIPQALPGNYQVRPGSSPISSVLGAPPVSVMIPNQDTTNLIIPLPTAKDVQGIVVNTAGAGVEGSAFGELFANQQHFFFVRFERYGNAG
jgi:hypothetical protein